jgi:hypothetical protein
MNDQEIRTLDMFRGVRAFDIAHAGNFAAGSLGRELFDAVRQAIDDLSDQAAAESVAGGSKLQNTAGRAVARETLRQKMEAYRRTARSMAVTVPGLEEKFRIPRNASDQALINTARAFIQDATPLKAEFIRHEMPPTFLEALGAAIDALEDAIGDQKGSQGARKAAAASIDGAIERGLEAVRRLDPIVRNKFADQPNVVAEWQSARRIQRGPRSQTGGGNANNNPPPTP